MKKIITTAILLSAFAANASIEPAATPANGVQGYGKFYLPEGYQQVDKSAHFKVAFDVSVSPEPGEISKHMNSLARFINMQVGAGVNPENIELALVIHGKATRDVLDNTFFKSRYGKDNANQALIAELIKHNTKVYVCGQSASYYEVGAKQLIPGVTMALSAMTAHAQLQQAGYTVNPF